jgi:RNA polymerase sigma factor (sigma-70 family)
VLERLGFRPTQMEASEREQYRAAIRGDREAFEMIIRTQSRTLFAIAYGILQNREEAEDAVQDSLVKAWKTRWRVRDPEKFPAWLATVARHNAHDVFRKRRTVPLSKQMIEPIEPEPANASALDCVDYETRNTRAPETVAAVCDRRQRSQSAATDAGIILAALPKES